jgi:adenylate cyclase
MPSLVPGFEYDIFISYRHNDNRSGWVTDFVNALQEELAATIKEPLSIYFDKNPHDGLLETHNVDRSLEGKLRCLIFIPIISQTYCDPKSFAWQHEFCAFNKLAKEDKFGRDVKLSSGNVASRILPIKIHDLDAEDNALLESELGGALRAIEFIFRSPGVHRPLRTKDDDVREINHSIFYRDQINKVANAAKEIITALKNSGQPSTRQAMTASIQPTKSGRRKIALASTLIILLALITYWLYPKFISVGEQDKLDKSIAVLPFVDMSPEHDQEYFADGLSEELLNLLAQIRELKVIGRTSSFQFKGKNQDLREIGKKLNVGRVLEGSVRKSENSLKITAQLIDTRDGSHLWSQSFNRTLDDVFKVQDEIAQAVVAALKVSMLNDSLPARKIPVNAEAYNAFMQGKFFYESNFDTAATRRATHYFEESIHLDSTFALPWTYLSMCYWRRTTNSNMPMFKAAKRAAQKALELDPSLSIAIVNMAEILDNEYDLTGADEKMKLALKLDPDNPYVLRNAGRFYTLLGRTEESINFCKRALQNDPIQRTALSYLLRAYFFSGQYKEAEITGKKFKELWSDDFDPLLIRIQLETGELEKALKGATILKNDVLLAAALFRLNRNKEGDNICTQLANKCANDCAYSIALAYAYGGEKEKVLTWLEKSYSNKEKALVYLRVEPVFKNFLNEPRFKGLLKKMKFPD